MRRAVIFGRHDLVHDAPISRIDVLTCRNTLMYLNAETQTQVLNRLHFALCDDGLLFVGKAEMLDQAPGVEIAVADADPVGFGRAHDLFQLLQLRALLANEQLRVADDIEEKNVPDLEAQLWLLLFGH